MESVCKGLPKRNQPRIAAFLSEGVTEYLILCESMCLCKCPTLQITFFTAFATYYCFNLDYPKPAMSFIQLYSGLHFGTSRL